MGIEVMRALRKGQALSFYYGPSGGSVSDQQVFWSLRFFESDIID